MVIKNLGMEWPDYWMSEAEVKTKLKSWNQQQKF